MALSSEGLRSHFDAHNVPHKRVYYWHAHTYCPEEHLHVGQQFRNKITDVWKEDDRISVHTMYNTAVGPHPHPNFET
jgi:aromatic ring-cleaving dioxygenase